MKRSSLLCYVDSTGDSWLKFLLENLHSRAHSIIEPATRACQFFAPIRCQDSVDLIRVFKIHIEANLPLANIAKPNQVKSAMMRWNKVKFQLRYFQHSSLAYCNMASPL